MQMTDVAAENSFFWVEIRGHTENQLPGTPKSVKSIVWRRRKVEVLPPQYFGIIRKNKKW